VRVRQCSHGLSCTGEAATGGEKKPAGAVTLVSRALGWDFESLLKLMALPLVSAEVRVVRRDRS
jgi:hypothetical protein